jgi:hypothetical protein
MSTSHGGITSSVWRFVAPSAARPLESPNRLVLVAFASLFVNALVLFFVARPIRALLLLAVYVTSVVSLFAASSASGNDALFTTAMCALLLGPGCIAGIEYYWHSAALRQGPVLSKDTQSSSGDQASSGDSAQSKEPSPASLPRFLGTRDLEYVRNQLEIAIFHRKDRIDLLAKLSYFAAALQSVLAALDKAWFDLSVSLLLIGLAYTIKAHESRVVAVVYTLFGGLVAAEFIRCSVPPSAVSLPVLISMLGISFSAASFSLARLRRLRQRIPLEPAAHLRDP